MARSLPIVGDFDGALRQAALSLEQLRGQDEPFWTALAAFTVGSRRRPWAGRCWMRR